MTKERTKAELLKEIEYFKKVLEINTTSQINLYENISGLIQSTMRYQARVNRFDRKFGKIMFVANTLLLVFYTTIFFLGR